MAKGKLSTPFINGFEFGWGNIQILINGVALTGVTSINYNEAADVQALYGAGRQMIAYGTGNYTAEADITVLSSEVIALQDAARASGIADGNIMGLVPFDIIISYIPTEGQGEYITDTLKNCVFTKNERSMSQADPSLEVGLDIMVSHIEWGETL